MKEGVIKDEQRRRRKKEAQLLQGLSADSHANESIVMPNQQNRTDTNAVSKQQNLSSTNTGNNTGNNSGNNTS